MRIERPTILEVLSETFLVAGTLVALFAIWMLVWTDVTATAAHHDAIQALTWATTPTPGASAQPATSAPDPVATALTQGATIAVLRVPRFGDDYLEPISEGVDKVAVLDALGIGHYPGTVEPGQVGNFALAAHRTTFGKPFSRIVNLTVGDELIIDTPQARYVYKVTSHEVVDPTQTSVVAPEPDQPGAAPSNRWITLTTCHPKFSARQRYVVHGVLDSWTPKSPPGASS